MASVVERALNRSSASEERSRRRKDARWRRMTAASETQGFDYSHQAGPEELSEARETAGRIGQRLRSELTPKALEVLRAWLVDPAKATSVLLAELGTSAATLSRARATLRAIVKDEYPDCRPELEQPLRDALYSILTAA
jgi:hypothetical protein